MAARAGASVVTDTPAHEALLLDEMFSPRLAESLQESGFDVLAVAGHPILAAASAGSVWYIRAWAWAARSATAGSIAAAYRPRRMMPVLTPAG